MNTRMLLGTRRAHVVYALALAIAATGTISGGAAEATYPGSSNGRPFPPLK